MKYVAPTVTATDQTLYRKQLEEVQEFANRLHLDIMDGHLAPVKSLPPSQLWWRPGPLVDIHVMYKKPKMILETLVGLQPDLIILHASAEDLEECIMEIKSMAIGCGIALLPEEDPEDMKKIISKVDHVLIFSGNLGHFGGEVDFSLTKKIDVIRKINPNIEIGWDGGVNLENAKKLAESGVDVLNVGGGIHKQKDPEIAYDKLVEAVEGV